MPRRCAPRVHQAVDAATWAGSTPAAPTQQLAPLLRVPRSHPGAHRYQVTCATWYPVDSGLFVSGSADNDVKVWDTNM